MAKNKQDDGVQKNVLLRVSLPTAYLKTRNRKIVDKLVIFQPAQASLEDPVAQKSRSLDKRSSVELPGVLRRYLSTENCRKL